MDAHPPNDSSNNVRGTEMLSNNPEPVYRFYLSPPPTAPMQTGISGYQAAQHQPQPQPMYPTSMGMMAYNPYMTMSPPPGPGPQGPPQMAGVGAFGQPAFYAQHTQHHHPHQHQAMYFPSAYGMAAMQMPNASAVSLAAPTPMPASSAGLTAPGNVAVSQAAASERGEVDLTRTRTPIVNEAGVPMGGFGLDRDGQYIEIKFPTFGQAQVQQMLQQLHISQQPQVQAQPVVTQVPVAVRPPAAKQQQQQQQEQPTQPATPVSSAAPAGPTPPPQATATVSASKLETTSSQTIGEISIYDAEGFANAHMEDIVFESKAFFWKIENWDKLERRATSEMFRCGGHMWRILLRPFGSSHKGVLSLFLECLGAVDSSEDWRCTCRFVLAVANPEEPEHNTHGAAYHCFHRNNPNWGFTRFMKLADLRTAQVPGVRPYIEDGACTIAAYLHVIKEPSQ
ncbi:ubiquitin-specific protease ubp15 [Kickxella alabastrina]|uniref:Ubiquitin-specific protease ubp15 n=1 Tax=Kickxella alabastrina TaxID=61397 RepID=A0ACC1IKM5_9FUNG|nr:ubiquitin-specific protease ubp15 [Kickxella alabastrina]